MSENRPENPPSPFSRQGSDAGDSPTAPGGPSAGSEAPDPMTAGTPVPAPEPTGPQAWPSYPSSGSDATYHPLGTAPDRPYDGAEQAYPPPAYDAQQQSYGGNPYDPQPNPYLPSYGGYAPYGVAPLPHPKATPALICGILGLVLGLSCGVGGLVGIGGIVMGRRARREIDADPRRYTGRSMASAGFGLGIAGLAVLAGYTLLFVILGVTGNLN